MAGPSSRTVADRQTSIQIQTAVYGIPIPVVYGTNRVPANLVWFANFQANSHTTKTGGKGLGGSSSSTTYTYTASAILALAEGTIQGIGAVWKDKDKTTLSALGLSLFTGSPTQPVWSFLTGYSVPGNWSYDYEFGYYGTGASFIDQAINYSGTAYLASSAYDLGDAATVPNHSFELFGKLIIGGGINDANPAAIIPDILTSVQYGLGFSSGKIGSLSTYSTYCQAAGIFLSPAYTQQRATADCIQELCDATNSAPFWSDGKLKIVPYGDATITGNGATYTPDLTPVYDLSDDDFAGDTDAPVLVTRTTPADAYNRVQVQFRNRLNQYNQEVVSVEDQDAIEKFGLKTAPMITADFICEAAVAKQVAQLALQRLLYKRNTYEFTLNARFAMLEPMDIVTLTDPGLEMVRVPVRLIEIEEQDDSFRCTAEDLPIGVASAPAYAHDNGLRWQNTTAIPAGDAADPIIFELPAETSTTGLALAIAAGRQSGDLMYGGCRVWLSLDGLNYREEGIIYGSSRYGTLAADLASHAAGIDTTNTMSVLLRSGGQLLSGSTDDLTKGTTQIIVGDEYLSYQNAALIGTDAYNLTTLKRGLYNTSPAAHAAGTPWVRVDAGVANLVDIDASMIGQTVYIKLTSFNVYSAAEQDLADVSPYTYTVSGTMKALQLIPGRTTVGGPLPSYKESSVGDIHIGDDGTYYRRVSATGILLGGKVVVLDGKRPILPWVQTAAQPITDAAAAAAAAYTAANAAIDAVAGLADDGTLTINEKITKLIPESARLADKWTSLSGVATSLGVSTSAASSARTAWLAMLAALSPAWNDITQDTPVVRATYDGARDAYDAALYALAQAIDAKAATLSHWSGVADDDGNKPDDNATVGAPSGTNVGSTPATTVEAGANAGNAGLNSDGSVKGGKVLTASLANASVVGVTSATVSSISTSSFTLQDALSLTVTPDAADPTKSAFLILVSIKGYCRSATQGLPFKVAVTNTALTNSIANPDPTNSYSALTTYETVVSGLTGATTFKLQFCLLGASTSGAVIEEATITAFELKKTLP